MAGKARFVASIICLENPSLDNSQVSLRTLAIDDLKYPKWAFLGCWHVMTADCYTVKNDTLNLIDISKLVYAFWICKPVNR